MEIHIRNVCAELFEGGRGARTKIPDQKRSPHRLVRGNERSKHAASFKKSPCLLSHDSLTSRRYLPGCAATCSGGSSKATNTRASASGRISSSTSRYSRCTLNRRPSSRSQIDRRAIASPGSVWRAISVPVNRREMRRGPSVSFAAVRFARLLKGFARRRGSRLVFTRSPLKHTNSPSCRSS